MALSCVTPDAITTFLVAKESLGFNCRYVLSQNLTQVEGLDFFAYLSLFLKTLLLETPIYLLFFYKSSTPIKWRMLHILLLNLATHPAVAYFFPLWLSHTSISFGNYVAGAELFAILTETFYLQFIAKFPASKAFAASFIANLISWWLGLLLFG